MFSADQSCCTKCGRRIVDKYYLATKDGVYHSHCLRCEHCDLELAGQVHCYNRNGQIYCRADYERLFHRSATVCSRCGLRLQVGQFVQRANSSTLFHLDCFRCVICDIVLQPGQRYAFLQPNTSAELFCELHFANSTSTEPQHTPPSQTKGKPSRPPKDVDRKFAKNKRNRTSFKMNQMAEMKAFFESNKNPDSAQLARLAAHTGLQPRVLRNKRAKERRNFLQQKSIGPLIVPEEIDLKAGEIDSLDSKKGDSESDELDECCYQVSKRDQYSCLFAGLSGQLSGTF